MPVTLTGLLPRSDESNGLNALDQKITANPDELVIAVVVLDVAKVTQNVDTNEVVPTVRVKRIEPILDADDSARLGQIATRAFERRTGATVLPLDMEDEIRATFGELDTGGDDAA